MTDFETLNAIFDRRYSCRAFRPDPVPDEIVEQIVTAAGRTPSWSNTQTWQVTVTRPEQTDKFRTALTQAAQAGSGMGADLEMPAGYSGVHLDRRREVGWALYNAVGVKKGDREGSARQSMRNFALFDAPHVAILTSGAELRGWGALDCGGFVTSFCLAAAALGVDTIAQAAVANFAPLIHDHFDIPEDRLVLCAISFGYGDPDHPANSFRAPRIGVGDVLTWKD